MAIRLEKGAVVSLFCCCRQAELSLDRSLTSDKQWQGLRQYYDAPKREGIQSLIELLTSQDIGLQNVPARGAVACISYFAPISYLVRRIANFWKSSWSFANGEICFILAKLIQFKNLLESEIPGRHDDLV